MRRFVALCLMAVALATAPAHAGLWDSLWGNSNEANFDKALKAFESHDDATALREFRPLAEQGHAGAQFYLGFMYKNGDGVPQDYKEALKWYNLSVEQGYAEAQANLGVMYAQGQVVEEDSEKAAELFRLAAEQGHATAQSLLGQSYSMGWGIEKNKNLAHMWFNVAASNGYKSAAKSRDRVARRMSPEQIEKAQDMARECIAKDYKGC